MDDQIVLQRDPTLLLLEALEKETFVVDENVLQTARTRITMVMKQCGVNGGMTGSPKMPDNAQMHEAVDSAMAKQMSAMDAMVKKCNDAARAMAKQQSEMGARSNAIAHGHDRTSRERQVEGFYHDAAPGKGKGRGKDKGRDRSRCPVAFGHRVHKGFGKGKGQGRK